MIPRMTPFVTIVKRLYRVLQASNVRSNVREVALWSCSGSCCSAAGFPSSLSWSSLDGGGGGGGTRSGEC